MNITETKFHQMLMYCGRIPCGSNIDGAVGIIRRAISVMHVTGLPKALNKGRVMGDYINCVLDAVDLLYGYPTDKLRYLIAVEYVDRVRKLMKAERDFYHSPRLHACKGEQQ